jgi:tRNA(Ile)-lysidine synthase
VDIGLKAFDELHPAMQKQLVMRGFAHLSGNATDLESVHVENVCALARGQRGSRIVMPDRIFAVLGYDGISLQHGYGTEKTEEEVCCAPCGVYEFLGEKFLFSLEDRGKNDEIPTNRYTKWFDYDKINHRIILRTRRPGDYLSNVRGSHKKLKDYLIDCKIPREDRDNCILLADGDHIIWVVGMRISEEYKVTEDTRRILKVQKL